MKKTITLLTVLSLLLSLLAISASAQSEAVTHVFVTVAVKGELVATQAQVEVTDVDDDGALTVNDALYAVHKKLYEGGVDAGYGYYQSEYGLSMSKLWGDESGMYGYYLNNASCMSLADPVKDGDHVTAFVYKNADWTDVYAYFDVTTSEIALGDTISLTLSSAGYDESWNPITVPVEGATILFNGQPTSFVTDAQGKVTVTLDTAGDVLISACSDAVTLVPPVCTVKVPAPATEETTEEQTTEEQTTQEQTTQAPEQPGCKAIAGAGLIALLPLACLCIKRKEK